jgi:hypothetical protein
MQYVDIVKINKYNPLPEILKNSSKCAPVRGDLFSTKQGNCWLQDGPGGEAPPIHSLLPSVMPSFISS